MKNGKWTLIATKKRELVEGKGARVKLKGALIIGEK